jgi:hypothetical protein
LNLEILTRGLGYRKEVGVVQMWLDMYRDCGEYIWTWLETGEVREWTDVPLQAEAAVEAEMAMEAEAEAAEAEAALNRW